MYTVFDPGHCGVSASVYEIAPLAQKYGIGGVAVPQNLLEDPKAGVAAADFIFDHGLRWSLLPTPADFFTESVTDAAFDSALERFKRWADAGEKMGGGIAYLAVWNGSNARNADDQFVWVWNGWRCIWKVADDHGLRYGMEFLGPCPLQRSFRYPFFNSLSGILALADAVSPRCGFLFDTYHWYTGSDQRVDEAYLAAAQVERMVNFHLNDGVPGRTRTQQEDLERQLPLTSGIIDATLPYRLFERAGYAGPVLCEPLRPWQQNAEGRSLEQTMAQVSAAYERVRQAAQTPPAQAAR